MGRSATEKKNPSNVFPEPREIRVDLAKASVSIISSSYQRWNMRISTSRVFLLIEKSLYIACDRCLLVNDGCPFGILSRSTLHGRNMAENCVNKNIYRQQ